MYNLIELMNPLLSLAQKAGEVILEVYHQSHQYPVHQKPDHSPVTQADLMANDVLRAGLKKLTPDLPFLSEEESIVPWVTRQHWPMFWLVDPLDGTREFLKHSGEFTINIALISEHQAILGILYVPVTGECYYAARNQGAFKEANGHTQKIQVKSWDQQSARLLVSHGAKEEIVRQHFSNLGQLEMIKMSSALKFGKVAEGLADMAPRLGDTSEWDTAAGQCILEEAGGALLNLQGEPLRYNTKESLLNPHFVAVGDKRLVRVAFLPL